MKVVILRGMPGSGKSTWIEGYRKTWRNADAEGEILVCSADDEHIINGKYDFRPENIAKAHLNCKQKFKWAFDCVDKPDHLIVDNTNTTAWEIAFYWDLAVLCGEKPRIVRVYAPFEVCLERQTHNVPHSTMWTMWQNLNNERLPAQWKEEIVFP